MSIKSYLVFSSTETYQITSYCLSMIQPNIAMSLIEKRTNEYVGRSILGELEFQKDNRYLTFHYFRI